MPIWHEYSSVLSNIKLLGMEITNCWKGSSKQDGRTWCFMGQAVERAWVVEMVERELA